MHFIEEQPWILYMDIDDETGEHFLEEDAPDDVKKQYAEYLRKNRQMAQEGIYIEK